MTTYDTETITEDQAIHLYYDIARRFGWQGTFFTREDAENSWQEYHNQTEPFTNEMWDTVLGSWVWRKGIHQLLTERGWELVHEAVGEVLAETSK